MPLRRLRSVLLLVLAEPLGTIAGGTVGEDASAGGTVAAAAASTRRMRGSTHEGTATHGAQSDDVPTCSCDCCDVVYRRPDEVIAGAGVKCAPSTQHSGDMCTEQCSMEDGDRVLRSAAVENFVEMLRYCFFECKPASGPQSLANSQCIALDPLDVQFTVDKDGNAKDPAVIYNGRPNAATQMVGGASAALLAAKSLVNSTRSAGQAELFRGFRVQSSAASAVQAFAPAPAPGSAPGEASPGPAPAAFAPSGAPAGGPVTVSTEEAWKALAEGEAWATAQGQSAQAEATRTRQVETTYEGGVSRSVANDPYTAVADIRAHATGAQQAAQRAGESARAAVEAYREARAINWKTAIDTASQEILQLRDVARTQREMQENRPKTWQEKAREAVKKATSPYLDSMNAAQESAYQYGAQADMVAKEAKQLDSQAKAMAQTAYSLNKAGKREEAELMIEDARAVAQQAQDQSSYANNMYNTAGVTAQSVQQFYEEAKVAAAAAAREVRML